MKTFLIVLNILLILIDIVVYIRFRKICKEKTIGEEIETKYIMPHSIAMSIISIMICGINLILAII